MTIKTFSLFALCLLIGAVLLACGGGDSANTGTTNSAAGTTAPAGDKIGVPECDDYIAKYEACVSGKVPEAARATYKQSLDTMRTTWKKAAETPQGKAALATGCKQALEQAKANLGSFGCSW